MKGLSWADFSVLPINLAALEPTVLQALPLKLRQEVLSQYPSRSRSIPQSVPQSQSARSKSGGSRSRGKGKGKGKGVSGSRTNSKAQDIMGWFKLKGKT